MATNWAENDRLERVANALIEEHHPNLAGVTIKFLSRDDTPREGDHDRFGGVAKKTGADAALVNDGDPFFILWVPDWTMKHLKDDQEPGYADRLREFQGLVDHLLCFMDAGRDEEGDVKLVKNVPDFSGFSANLERFGLWHESFEAAFTAMRGTAQLVLPLDGARPAMEIAGMGEIGDESEIPAAYAWRAGCGCVVDTRRFGRECPIHATGPTAEEAALTADDAEPESYADQGTLDERLIPDDGERLAVAAIEEAAEKAGLTVESVSANGGVPEVGAGEPLRKRSTVPRKSLREFQAPAAE